MFWQGETDTQCSHFRDTASNLLPSSEGWKRELIGSSTPTTTLDVPHSHLAGKQHGSRLTFFNGGLTRACLKHCGTIPDDKDLFMILITTGIIPSKQS